MHSLRKVLLKLLIPLLGELIPKGGGFGTAVKHVTTDMFFNFTQWTNVIISYTGTCTEQADSVTNLIFNFVSLVVVKGSKYTFFIFSFVKLYQKVLYLICT